MTACRADINQAIEDRAIVDHVENIFRHAMLTALSEARAATTGMEQHWRGRLMDAVSKQFHPDGNISDNFSDAFSSLKIELDAELETRRADMRLPPERNNLTQEN